MIDLTIFSGSSQRGFGCNDHASGHRYGEKTSYALAIGVFLFTPFDKEFGMHRFLGKMLLFNLYSMEFRYISSIIFLLGTIFG